MKIKYSEELLTEAISNSTTWADVCRYLNRPIAGGNISHFKKMANKYNIEYSHFLGKAWSRNKNFNKQPAEKYLVYGFVSSHDLKRRLIRDGLKEHCCEICGLTKWLAKPIPIELDHMNGDHLDNRLENLRIVCPNCHAQTDTYRGKNIKRM